jgi:hypothetical protein
VSEFAGKRISYEEAASVADERTMAALIAIGSPPLELDANGKVAVLGGMSEEMVRAYGVAFLGESNGKLWANLGYPIESDASRLADQPEISSTVLNSGDLLAKSTKRSSNLALVQLTVVSIVALGLWFGGFNVLITGWISAYIGTWIISPVAGIVLSLFTYAVYRLLEFIKRIF